MQAVQFVQECAKYGPWNVLMLTCMKCKEYSPENCVNVTHCDRTLWQCAFFQLVQILSNIIKCHSTIILAYLGTYQIQILIDIFIVNH